MVRQPLPAFWVCRHSSSDFAIAASSRIYCGLEGPETPYQTQFCTFCEMYWANCSIHGPRDQPIYHSQKIWIMSSNVEDFGRLSEILIIF